MLEVCFSDSAKGALLLAQHCGGDVIAASVSVITNARGLRAVWEKRKALREYKKRRAELKKLAVPLGGRREDVVSVSFGLSEGDIRSPITPGECPRKACIRDWLAFSRYGEKILETEVNAFWDGCLADLRKLQARPDRVRIWLDATPDAQCGLLFLAGLYREGGTELHLVELPRQVRRPDGCLVEYRGWAEIEPEPGRAVAGPAGRKRPPAGGGTGPGGQRRPRLLRRPYPAGHPGRALPGGADHRNGAGQTEGTHRRPVHRQTAAALHRRRRVRRGAAGRRGLLLHGGPAAVSGFRFSSEIVAFPCGPGRSAL